MELNFCDKCGRKITEEELDSGQALMMGERFYCPKCKEIALAEIAGSSTERAQPPVSAKRRSARTRPSGKGSGVRRSAGHRTSGPRRAVSERRRRTTTGPRKAVSGSAKRVSGPRDAVGVRKSGPRGAVGSGRTSGRVSDRMRPVPQGGGSNTTVIVAAVAMAAIGGVIAFVVFGGSGGEETRTASSSSSAPAQTQPAPTVQRPPTAEPPVVKSQPVGVPDGAKSANDFPPGEAPEAPGDGPGILKLLTAEHDWEIRAAAGPNGWKVLRSNEAKLKGERGFRVTPIPERKPKPRTDNQVAIRLGEKVDLTNYRKLGIWLGGKNADGNRAKISLVVGDDETPLTGSDPIEYGTRWKFYSFDLVGKRDDVRGVMIQFNASSPPKPATFEFWLDEMVAYGGETEVAAAPTTPAAETTAPETTTPTLPSRTLGPSFLRPRRPGAPTVIDEPDEPETTPETTQPSTPAAPPRPPSLPPREPKPEPKPATPTPQPTVPVSTGSMKLIWRETFDKFESGDKHLGWSGGPEKTNTYQGSAGARKAIYKPKSTYYAWSLGFNYYTSMPPSKRYMGEAIFKAESDCFISFQYYLDGPADKIHFFAMNKRAGSNFNYDIKNPVKGKWAPAVVKTMDFWGWGAGGKKAKTQDGDIYSEMSMGVGKPQTEGITFIIDNFTITKGGAPRDIELQIARANKLTRDQTGDPVGDGFFLMPAVIAGLKEKYKADKVTAGRVLKVGGDSATSTFHVGGIKGLSAVKRFAICGKNKGAGDVTAKFPTELAAQKPEIVTIMFGIGDLANNRQPMEARTSYVKLVTKTLDAGAIPVLFTLPLPMTLKKEANQLIGEHNKVIMSVGREQNVPVVDANSILTDEPENARKYFSGMKMKKAGHEAVNASFEKLYGKLKKFVMNK